jgi:nicotinamidase-related amidase
MLLRLAFLAFAIPLVAAEPALLPIRTQVPVEVAVPTVVPDKSGGKIVKYDVQTVWKSKAGESKFVPERSAFILCDIWDDHWCKEASKRCDVIAQAVAPLVEAARKQGVTIIHCPSDTMDFYKEHPARVRTLALKPVELPKNKDLPNPPLPIDDSDGGCDDAEPVKSFKAWKRQHAAITIDGDKDYVTDKGADVYSILKDRNIDKVFVLGVHTNMCVLNRTFAIKQMRKWDVDCLLVRDLTDAMYNPKMKPFVSHEKGTQMVVEYIERNWCPTCCSKDLFKALGK